MPEPLLNDIIRLRSNRLRAVRLEDDVSNGNLLRGYTLTAQALNTLDQIIAGLTNR